MSSQVCPYCNNVGFEEQDGILYCTNCSRQLEGGFQLVADDPEFGTQGKVTRQKITRSKVKITQIYRGKRAYRLYLHAWQHILWKQCFALVRIGAPDSLWTVARDLWGLKLSSLVTRLDDQVSNDDAAESHATSKHSLEPKLYDSVALVYLAALLVRYPLPLERLFRHIIQETVCFVRAVHHLPYDISSHLPPEYQEALDTTAIPTRRELLKNVTAYVLQTVRDYELTVPALNWRLVLFEWIEELALPIEVFIAVQKVAAFLEFDFTYKVSEKRRTLVANPESQLACLIAVVTKYLFPVSNSASKDAANGLAVDWAAWLDVHVSKAADEKRRKPRIKPGQHIMMESADVPDASSEELDEYMNWYERTFVSPEQAIDNRKSELERKILDMFPLVAAESAAVIADEHEDTVEQENLTRTVQKTVMYSALQSKSASSGRDDQVVDSHYIVLPDAQAFEAFGSVSSAPSDRPRNPMLYLHQELAEHACLNLTRFLKAVRHTERKIETWVAAQKRAQALADLYNERQSSLDRE